MNKINLNNVENLYRPLPEEVLKKLTLSYRFFVFKYKLLQNTDKQGEYRSFYETSNKPISKNSTEKEN